MKNSKTCNNSIKSDNFLINADNFFKFVFVFEKIFMANISNKVNILIDFFKNIDKKNMNDCDFIFH